jgi:hypothetical protein
LPQGDDLGVAELNAERPDDAHAQHARRRRRLVDDGRRPTGRRRHEDGASRGRRRLVGQGRRRGEPPLALEPVLNDQVRSKRRRAQERQDGRRDERVDLHAFACL